MERPTGRTLRLPLPCDWQELDKKVSTLIGREQHDYICNCLDCRVPALRGMISDAGADIAEVNCAAERLAALSDNQIRTYKAVIEAMEVTGLDEAVELVQNIDEYILSPKQASFEDIARGQLSVIMGEQEMETLLPHVNLYQYGRALQDRYQSVLTEYGSVERTDNQPLMVPQEQSQPTMGGMEMTQG